MNLDLSSLYQEEKDIPPQFQVKETIEQKEYLVNGELVPWEGKYSTVSSPIFIKNGDRREQKVIGKTPIFQWSQ